MDPAPIETVEDGVDWMEIAPSFIRYAHSAAKNRRTISRFWKQLRLASEQKVGLGEPKTNVAIFGRGNVGKSVLRDALRGETRSQSYRLPKMSDDAERHLLTVSEWANLITVVPGQNIDERAYWSDRVFSGNNHLNGVIYVADWGYTKPRTNAATKLLKDKGATNIQKLREHYLGEEIEDFRSVCRDIRKARAAGYGPKWLIIAVTKSDLFNGKLDLAEEYYRVKRNDDEPDFTSEIGRVCEEEIIKHVGLGNIKIASAPVCSWTENFTWGKGTVKSSILDRERQALLTHFVYLMDQVT